MMTKPSVSRRLMILPKFALRTESGLMMVKVRLAMTARIICGSGLEKSVKRQRRAERIRETVDRHLDVEVAAPPGDERQRQERDEDCHGVVRLTEVPNREEGRVHHRRHPPEPL